MSGQAQASFENTVAARVEGARLGSLLAEYFRNPHRLFARLRAESPILHIPKIDCWVITRFDDIRAIFMDSETFSPVDIRLPTEPLCPRAKEIVDAADFQFESALVDEKPPTHGRHRRIFGKGLAARSVERLELTIRRFVSGHIEGFIDDGRADLISQLLLPAGANIWLMLASGNRDETVFPDGDTLDIERKNAGEHLSLGYGVHGCIGVSLARLQMKVVLEELTRRLPDMRPAGNGVSDVLRALMFSGSKRLPVEWD